MAVTLTRSEHEIQQMPLVELAYEILKVKKEPLYFRDMMSEIQELRNLTDDDVAEVIARVFTEINIDGRFICIGQNIWGLNRWYPTDKVTERLSGKKFIRKSGDAFSDDDDADDEYDEVEAVETEEVAFVAGSSDSDSENDNDDDEDYDEDSDGDATADELADEDEDYDEEDDDEEDDEPFDGDSEEDEED